MEPRWVEEKHENERKACVNDVLLYATDVNIVSHVTA